MKKIFAILLSLAMVMCMIPMATGVAFAAGENPLGTASGQNITNAQHTVVTLEGYSSASDVKYSGYSQAPKVTVKYGETTKQKLYVGSDYTLQWQKKLPANIWEDVDTSKVVDAGTYRAVIKGKGSYSGYAASEDFIIKSLPIDSKGVTITINNQARQAQSTTYTINSEDVSLAFNGAKQDGIKFEIKNAVMTSDVNGNAEVQYLDSSRNKNFTSASSPVKVSFKALGLLSDKFGLKPNNVSGKDYVFEYGTTSKSISNVVSVVDSQTGKTVSTSVLPTTSYTLTCPNFYQAGTHTVTLTPNNTCDYSGELTCQIKVAKAQGSKLYFGSVGTKYVGDFNNNTIGQLIAKDLVVKTSSSGSVVDTSNYYVDDIVLPRAVDGSITSGTATFSVKFTGDGDYEGVKTGLRFTVAKRSLTDSKCSITMPNFEEGENPHPEITYTKDDATAATVLIEGVDYTVKYSVGTTSGTWADVSTKAVAGVTVSAAITGINDYTGSKTVSFKILKAGYNLKASGIIITPKYPESSACTYNGKAIYPTFTVVQTGVRTLIQGTDYKVIYSYTDPKTEKEVILTGYPVNAGTYNVKLQGIGNYTGTVEQSNLTINPFNLTNGNAFINIKRASKEGAFVATITATVGANQVSFVQGTDFYIFDNPTYQAFVTGGYVDVIALPNSNLTGEKDRQYYTIDSSVVVSTTLKATLSQTSGQYTAYGYAPAVTVYAGNTLLNEGNYTVTYKNALGTPVSRMTEVGTYKVVVEGIGPYAGYTGTTLTFTVTGNAAKITLNAGVNKVYTFYKNKADEFSTYVKGTASSGAVVTYSSSDPTVVTVDKTTGLVKATGKVGTAKIILSAPATTGYDAGTETVTIVVKPNKASISKVTSASKGTAKVSVNKQLGTAKYQVYMSRNSEFKKGTRTIKYITDNPKYTKTQALTVKGLTSGKTYYVKVRAMYTNEYGETKYGTFSTVQKIKVK